MSATISSRSAPQAAAALPEFEQLREQARAIKDHALAHLDLYLEAYEARVDAKPGGTVHFAETAEDARDIILGICRSVGARRPPPRASR